MLRMLGWETLGYADYGRFKNLLFPAVMSLLVLSIFEDSHFWRLVSSGLALLVLLLYIARGPLLLVALQYFLPAYATNLQDIGGACWLYALSPQLCSPLER
jgi:hypothetical protein